jgi:hypothetical protein
LCDPNAACYKPKIHPASLNETILTLIRKQAEVILNTSSLNELGKVGNYKKRVIVFEKEVNKCIEEQQRIYEQFILHAIERDEFFFLKSDCSERIKTLNTQISAITQNERDRQSGEKTAELARTLLDGELTPRELVQTLIEKVLVFPENQIEIHWKIAVFTATGYEHSIVFPLPKTSVKMSPAIDSKPLG